MQTHGALTGGDWRLRRRLTRGAPPLVGLAGGAGGADAAPPELGVGGGAGRPGGDGRRGRVRLAA
eukprot:7291025-Pyramimonas_sp.AAC.1